MKLQKQIQEKIIKRLKPLALDLVNESYKHSVPEGSESHFKLMVVSLDFENLTRVQRQQLVYDILSEEMRGGVHALAQRTYTPSEWDKVKHEYKFESPDCLGKKVASKDKK